MIPHCILELSFEPAQRRMSAGSASENAIWADGCTERRGADRRGYPWKVGRPWSRFQRRIRCRLCSGSGASLNVVRLWAK